MAKLITIEGMGKVYAQKLEAAGISGTGALLQSGARVLPLRDGRR